MRIVELSDKLSFVCISALFITAALAYISNDMDLADNLARFGIYISLGLLAYRIYLVRMRMKNRIEC